MIFLLCISFFSVISESQLKIITTSGMNAILPCVLQSKEDKPVYTAQWSKGEDIILSYRKNRKPIVNSSPMWKDKIKSRDNITDGDATITLLNVIKEHNGEYICKLRENSMPKKDIKIMLQVLPKEEPKDRKGAFLDDAQGQGWLTTTPVIYFGRSSKSDLPRVENINPTEPTQESITQRPWMRAILAVLVLVVLLLAIIVFVVLNKSKKRKQQNYRPEDVMEMKEVTASSVYEDMLQTQSYQTKVDEPVKYKCNPTYNSTPDPSLLYENMIIKT